MSVRPLLTALALSFLVGCHSKSDPAEPGDDVEQRFKTPEDWAKVFDDPSRDAWQKPDDVMAVLGVKAGMTVVDVGAGTGYFVRYLARAVGPSGRVIATDIDPSMIRYLNSRISREALTNVTPTLTTATEPGLPAGVDRVLIVDTWHWVEDRPAFAGKLAAVLASGAVVAVVEFTKESGKDPARHLRLHPEDVVAELTAAGFQAAVASESLPEQFVVLATKP